MEKANRTAFENEMLDSLFGDEEEAEAAEPEEEEAEEEEAACSE